MPRGRPKKKKPEEPETVQAETIDNSGEEAHAHLKTTQASSKRLAEAAPGIPAGRLTSSFDAFPPSRLNELADEMLIWFSTPSNLWLKDFAILHGMDWRKFESMADRSEKFRNALKICKDMQESKLFKLGLSKAISNSMPIFALKNTSGWRDVKDQPRDDIPLADGDAYLELAATAQKLGLSLPEAGSSRGSLTAPKKDEEGAVPATAVGVDARQTADKAGDSGLDSDTGVQEAPVGRDSESDQDDS
jgi:hypothetical protein